MALKFFLLLLVIVVAVAWLAIGRRQPPPGAGPAPKPPPRAMPPQSMVACAHCGVHLPAGEALRDAAGRSFCSEAHRAAGARDAG